MFTRDNEIKLRDEVHGLKQLEKVFKWWIIAYKDNPTHSVACLPVLFFYCFFFLISSLTSPSCLPN